MPTPHDPVLLSVTPARLEIAFAVAPQTLTDIQVEMTRNVCPEARL
jgi:hypothetical protein